jgi:hypothetical protein
VDTRLFAEKRSGNRDPAVAVRPARADHRVFRLSYSCAINQKK